MSCRQIDHAFNTAIPQGFILLTRDYSKNVNLHKYSNRFFQTSISIINPAAEHVTAMRKREQDWYFFVDTCLCNNCFRKPGRMHDTALRCTLLLVVSEVYFGENCNYNPQFHFAYEAASLHQRCTLLRQQLQRVRWDARELSSDVRSR